MSRGFETRDATGGSRVSTAGLPARFLQQSFYCRLVSTVNTTEFLLQTCQHGSYSRVSTADLPARFIQQSFKSCSTVPTSYSRLASTVNTAEFLLQTCQHGSYNRVSTVALQYDSYSRVAGTEFLLVVQ